MTAANYLNRSIHLAFLSPQVVLPFALFLIVFFPTYFFGGLTVGQRFLYLIFPFFALFLLAIGLAFERRIFYDSISSILFFLLVIFVASSFAKSSFIDVRTAVSHFRYLAYFLVYLCFFNIAIVYRLKFSHFIRFLWLMFYLCLIFVIAQFLFPDSYVLNIISSRKVISGLGIWIGGPFDWSYAFSFAVTPIFFYLVGSYLFGDFSPYKFFALLVLSVLILLGQSKAAYLSFFLIAIIFCFFGFFYGYRKFAVRYLFGFAFLSIFSTAFVGLYFDELGNIYRFVTAIQEGNIDASTSTRLNQLSVVFSSFENAPLFGRPDVYLVVENAYGYYLYNYGLIGLLGYCVIVVSITLKCFSTVKHIHRSPCALDSHKALSLAMLAFCFSIPIFSLASSPIDGHKTSYYFWCLIGAYFGSVRLVGLSATNLRNSERQNLF